LIESGVAFPQLRPLETKSRILEAAGPLLQPADAWEDKGSGLRYRFLQVTPCNRRKLQVPGGWTAHFVLAKRVRKWHNPEAGIALLGIIRPRRSPASRWEDEVFIAFVPSATRELPQP